MLSVSPQIEIDHIINR